MHPRLISDFDWNGKGRHKFPNSSFRSSLGLFGKIGAVEIDQVVVINSRALWTGRQYVPNGLIDTTSNQSPLREILVTSHQKNPHKMRVFANYPLKLLNPPFDRH
jgi:hypothetical protein